MPKLTVTSFLSLDGAVQSPYASAEDPNGDSQHGEWLVPYSDPDVAQYTCDALTRVDALLLGRRSYEILAEHWRCVDPDDPLAPTLTLLPKYVVSSTLQRTEWHNSQLVRGDVLEEVVKLKCGHYEEIQIQGSLQLAQTLIAHDIIDEYRLWFFPFVRGSGERKQYRILLRRITRMLKFTINTLLSPHGAALLRVAPTEHPKGIVAI